MWYHNGAWRIGSYSWFNSKELGGEGRSERLDSTDVCASKAEGRCHAYVKTSAQDLGSSTDFTASGFWCD